MFLFRWLRERWIGITLFVAIWLVVLCVPQLRLLFTVQAVGSSLSYQEYEWTPRLENDAFSIENLAERYPDDPNVLLQTANSGNSKTATRDIDALLRRFPNEKLLIALRLKRSLGWMRYDRLGGDFSNPRSLPYTTPSLEKSATPPNFTPQELQAAIAVAQRGRQLEPDNSYYDWALMYFYFAGYRDADAYRVLKEASRKPRYDDHSYDEVLAAIAAHEKVRPLLWEEKIVFASAVSFPHFAKYREMARLVSWQMWKAEQRGDHARAIEVRFDFARLCAPMMEGRNSIITGLVANACRAIMLTGNPARRVRNNQRPPNMSDANWYRLRARKTAQNFADYARAHGRADLVPEIRQRGESSGHFHAASRQIASQAFTSRSGWFGIPESTVSGVFSLSMLSRLSLVQILWLLSLCFFLWMVTLFSKPAPLQRRDVLTSTLFSTAIAAIFALAALRLTFGATGLNAMAQPQAAQIGAIWSGALFFLAPLLGGTLVPWSMTLWRMWNRREELFTPPPARYEGESARHLTRDYLPLAVTLCVWAMGFIAFACWVGALIAWLTNSQSWTLPFGTSTGQPLFIISDPAQNLTIAAAILTIMLYIGWLIKWRWAAPVKLRPLLHAALVWHRQTLVTYLIVSSLFYLLLSVATLELRREADTRFNDYLQRGEISLLNLK